MSEQLKSKVPDWMQGTFPGATKAEEIERTAEELVRIHKEQGVYFVLAFLYDSGYGRDDIKKIMDLMERLHLGFHFPKPDEGAPSGPAAP